MPYHPARRLEGILAALLPPVSREHVLGDLAECAQSPAQYAAAFVAVLPKVVFSELRRKVRADTGLGLMAGLSATALAVAAVATRGRALAVPGEWLRWAAPWAVWMAGCALAAAYGRAGTRLWNGWCVLAALLASIGTAALAGAHTAAAAAAIVVATVAHMAITLPRLGADLARLTTTPPPLSLDNVHERAQGFQRMIWWRNLRESGAAVFLLAMNINTLVSTHPDSPAAGAAVVLGVAGLACMVAVLHVKGGSRRVPDGLDPMETLHFHQAEIARQRDVLRAVPYWYLLPLAPGILANAIATWKPASPLMLLFVAAIFFGVARLNVWAARWLDRQLAEARALEANTRRAGL